MKSCDGVKKWWMKCHYTLFYMKMPPAFSSFMLVALEGIMLFFYIW